MEYLLCEGMKKTKYSDDWYKTYTFMLINLHTSHKRLHYGICRRICQTHTCTQLCVFLQVFSTFSYSFLCRLYQLRDFVEHRMIEGILQLKLCCFLWILRLSHRGWCFFLHGYTQMSSVYGCMSTVCNRVITFFKSRMLKIYYCYLCY